MLHKTGKLSRVQLKGMQISKDNFGQGLYSLSVQFETHYRDSDIPASILNILAHKLLFCRLEIAHIDE